MSWGELMVIGGVALIVIGPKDLPKALRTVGQMTTKVRRLAGEFQSQFNEAMREAELEDVRKDLETINRDVRNATATGFNPIQTIRDELKGAVESRPSPTAPAENPVAWSPALGPSSPETAVASIAATDAQTSAAFAPAEESGVPPVMAPASDLGHPVMAVTSQPLTDIAGPGLEQASDVGEPPVGRRAPDFRRTETRNVATRDAAAATRDVGQAQ